MAFADLLRGLAALVTVFGHFTGVFLTLPKVIAMFTMAEPLPAAPVSTAVSAISSVFALAWIGAVFSVFDFGWLGVAAFLLISGFVFNLGWLGTVLSVLDFGWLGVAIFFLISGFVIPLSLDSAESRAFLVKRLLRIFPTYWVALALGVAALFISAAFWSKPVIYSGIDYFANALLSPDVFARFDIPSVIWTLEVELKFYLLAPLFHASLKRGSLKWLFVWGAGVAAAYWFAIAGCVGGIGVAFDEAFAHLAVGGDAAPQIHGAVAACWGQRGFIGRFAWEAMFITYMLIGSVLYAHYRKLVTTRQAAVGIVFLFTSFVISWPLSSWAFLSIIHLLAYFWGLIIFTSAYLRRDNIRLTRPFRFLADISYPLYVVHPLVGYVTMRLLMAAGLTYLPSFAIALALVIAIATLMHVYVEAPSMALGKKLAARLSRAGRQPRPAFRESLPEALPPAGAPGAGEGSPVLERA